jgi:hypothetical protein
VVNKRAKVQKAVRLFEDFSGHRGDTIDRVEIPTQDDVLVVIGRCVAIAYEATRDGETAEYQHEFSPNARPELAVSFDGRRLYLLAGAYEFTSHGIEDR